MELGLRSLRKAIGVKIAIVGCGKIADAHVEEFRRISSVQLVAVCDREPLMAEVVVHEGHSK